MSNTSITPKIWCMHSFFYVRAVDPTFSVALKGIATHKGNITEEIKQKCHQIPDYCGSHLHTDILYDANYTIP